MTFHALVVFPNINISKIQPFRKKYDPHYNLINPHITLIFPIENTKILCKNLSNHIKSITDTFRCFDIELRGFTKSFDHWLFLLVKKGNKELIHLHDEFYKGILKPYLRNDLEYIPHISIGHFIKKLHHNSEKTSKNDLFNETKYKIALKEAEKLNLIYKSKVDTLQLIEIDDDFTQALNLMEFRLKSI